MKPVIAITMGDPAGIGAEIIVKALAQKKIRDVCIPIVIGDYAVMEDAVHFTKSGGKLYRISKVEDAVEESNAINLMDLHLFEKGEWKYKTVDAKCGKAAYLYVEKAIALAMKREVHAVVTGPLNKEALNLAGYPYSGHTEIFAKLTNTKNYAMLLMGGGLRVIHVSTHVSMREACERVTKERVYEVIRLAHEAMEMLGIRNPRIGVAGLNAHCSENGLFGHEEEKEIIPAIQKATAAGLSVEGPVPPDTVFVKAKAGQYDVVVAMYHDQGHIP